MASITITDLPEAVAADLRARADRQGRSVEQEVRAILQAALSGDAEARPDRNLTDIAARLFGPDGGVELELPPREPGRAPPAFD